MKVMTSVLVALFAVAAMAAETTATTTTTTAAPAATATTTTEHTAAPTHAKKMAKVEKKSAHKCKAGDATCTEAAPSAKK
jgi:hypothetical protein